MNEEFALSHQVDDIPQGAQVHVLNDLLDQSRVVVASIELHQVIAHFSCQKGTQIVQKLVSLLLL